MKVITTTIVRETVTVTVRRPLSPARAMLARRMAELDREIEAVEAFADSADGCIQLSTIIAERERIADLYDASYR